MCNICWNLYLILVILKKKKNNYTHGYVYLNSIKIENEINFLEWKYWELVFKWYNDLFN